MVRRTTNFQRQISSFLVNETIKLILKRLYFPLSLQPAKLIAFRGATEDLTIKFKPNTLLCLQGMLWLCLWCGLGSCSCYLSREIQQIQNFHSKEVVVINKRTFQKQTSPYPTGILKIHFDLKCLLFSLHFCLGDCFKYFIVVSLGLL